MTPEQREKLALYREDFPLFAREQLRIITKDARLVPFELNRVQRNILWPTVRDKIRAGRPVRVYNVKARQLGSSTFWQGINYWQGALRKYRRSLTAAHDDPSSSELFGKATLFHQHVDPWIRPMTRRTNRQELYFANPDPRKKGGLESKLLVATANNRNLGASQTLSFIHLSEFARYEALLQNIKATMAALLPTVPYEPFTFVVMETTAQGLGYAKDRWDRDDEYEKVFASWVGDESYTEPDPIDPTTILNVDAGEWGNEARVHDLVTQELDQLYPERSDEPDWVRHESLKRLAWRRRMIRDQFHGDLELFKQEYPLTAEEAFLTSGRSVFGAIRLHSLIRDVETLDRHPRTYRFSPDSATYVPDDHLFQLKVYEKPRPRTRYVIGADVSYGIEGKDYSAAHVLRLPERVQAAVYHAQIEPDEFADHLAALGKLYNWALLAPETFGPGTATVLRLMKQLFYPNIYRREVFDQPSGKYRPQMGWNTTRSSRPVLISGLLDAFSSGEWVLNDLDTLKEMTTFTDHGKGRFEAEPGKNDDLVMALGIALQAASQAGPGTGVTFRPTANDPSTVLGMMRREEQGQAARL